MGKIRLVVLEMQDHILMYERVLSMAVDLVVVQDEIMLLNTCLKSIEAMIMDLRESMANFIQESWDKLWDDFNAF